jgi:hypothetical protein
MECVALVVSLRKCLTKRKSSVEAANIKRDVILKLLATENGFAMWWHSVLPQFKFIIEVQ